MTKNSIQRRVILHPVCQIFKTHHANKKLLNGTEKKQIYPTYSSTSIHKCLKTKLIIHPCRLYCSSKHKFLPDMAQIYTEQNFHKLLYSKTTKYSPKTTWWDKRATTTRLVIAPFFLKFSPSEHLDCCIQALLSYKGKFHSPPCSQGKDRTFSKTAQIKSVTPTAT